MKTVIKNSAHALCLQPETLRKNPLNRPSASFLPIKIRNSKIKNDEKTPFFKAIQRLSKIKMCTSLPPPFRQSNNRNSKIETAKKPLKFNFITLSNTFFLCPKLQVRKRSGKPSTIHKSMNPLLQSERVQPSQAQSNQIQPPPSPPVKKTACPTKSVLQTAFGRGGCFRRRREKFLAIFDHDQSRINK